MLRQNAPGITWQIVIVGDARNQHLYLSFQSIVSSLNVFDLARLSRGEEAVTFSREFLLSITERISIVEFV